MNIGIVVAMSEERENISKILKKTLKDISEEILTNSLTKFFALDNNIFIETSGIGQNNAIISCSNLVHNQKCEKIYNIGTCGCAKSENHTKIGDIILFKENIIDYGFKLHPDKYKYDDCNISNISYDCILVTLNEYGTQNILKDKFFDNKFKNVFLDMEAYGIASFCLKNNIDYTIAKIVSDFCNEDEFDKNVVNNNTYFALENFILENILTSLVF